EELALVVRENLAFILARYRSAARPGLLDTKVDLLTGESFATPEQAGTVWSEDIVYTWIQGRGLEALAGHLGWLKGQSAAVGELDEICRVLHEVAECMESLRVENGGRLSFMMSREGGSLQVLPDGTVAPLDGLPDAANFSDLFYAKGLFAAGDALDDDTLRKEGEDYLRRTVKRIGRDEFASDQQPMDPRNPVRHVPGRISHGPRMIALGALSLLLEKTGDPIWFEHGQAFLRHILSRHVNAGRHSSLPRWGFIEFITEEGAPYLQDGRVLCDPGHALECVGLACKLLSAGLRTPQTAAAAADLVEQSSGALGEVFLQAFELGFNPVAGGICKSVDLQTGRACNDDLPWWSLPETIRAAALLPGIRPDLADACARIQTTCARAFLDHFVKPELGWMAVQTRNAAGDPIRAIPACPDVDPCYHTGLSLIDVLG
ncbi:MAG: AGE family epimerase/isomerase, partial [Lentisphaeria bacterium]|nr:AGE family epimerase/isomerase [Lentisphaeria bacterium]